MWRRALRDSASLRELRVDECGIRYEGCLAIIMEAGNVPCLAFYRSGLSTLDLSNNCIEDAGATQLADMLQESKSLTALALRCDVVDTSIGPRGFIALCAGVKKSASLRELDFSFRASERESFRLGWRGGKAVSSALRMSTTLTKLNLANLILKVRSRCLLVLL